MSQTFAQKILHALDELVRHIVGQEEIEVTKIKKVDNILYREKYKIKFEETEDGKS